MRAKSYQCVWRALDALGAAPQWRVANIVDCEIQSVSAAPQLLLLVVLSFPCSSACLEGPFVVQDNRYGYVARIQQKMSMSSWGRTTPWR